MYLFSVNSGIKQKGVLYIFNMKIQGIPDAQVAALLMQPCESQ